MSFMPDLSMDTPFSYAQTIVSKMLPYIYVIAGIGIGFAIVGRVASAFRRS
jgi:hypothetical protein